MNEIAMRTHSEHRLCGGDIEAVRRVIQTRPSEPEWPRDVSVLVPRCTQCKRLVDVTECRDSRLPGGVL